ncbi:hypothetical protein GCM10020221_03920 [Streptomyces thioluteus]|uniref:FAD-dependent thymidylate synthase n=1 Tax=Streptomyces thioluteus TaxID=66431 RepID=A0ABP6IVP1_STRTU
MKPVEPEVFLVARPGIDYAAVTSYLEEVGGGDWLARLDRGELDGVLNDPQNLAEFAGRICYRSWEPGLNPNVTRIRTDQDAYLANILSSMHGSVLEHVSFTFVLHNVSRVLTHELARHRVGVAVSQESLRFVRLQELPFWFPDWARKDPELMERATELLERMEEFQGWMAEHFQLDENGRRFGDKKHKTSFMRRFAPEGVATGLAWTANNPHPAPSDRGAHRAPVPRRRSGWSSAGSGRSCAPRPRRSSPTSGSRTGPGCPDGARSDFSLLVDVDATSESDETHDMPAADTADTGLTAPLTGREILRRAKEAAPLLAARSEEIEQARRLPDDVVELLRSTGVFRMAYPKAWQGPVMTPAEQTEVIEALAHR